MPQGSGIRTAVPFGNPYCKVTLVSRTLRTKEGHLF
ncbi:hypothetical protein VN12_17315 [Pirellula sp. SH-Sr6A]|nr:hypothetical protein VN12_17315 [Pirellula sp. SH-Sr6A]